MASDAQIAEFQIQSGAENVTSCVRYFRVQIRIGGVNPVADDALHRGVESAIIMDGRVPHSILMEILTDEGAGTMVVQGEEEL